MDVFDRLIDDDDGAWAAVEDVRALTGDNVKLALAERGRVSDAARFMAIEQAWAALVRRERQGVLPPQAGSIGVVRLRIGALDERPVRVAAQFDQGVVAIDATGLATTSAVANQAYYAR